MTLFDFIPIARATDPQTSHESASRVTASGKRAGNAATILAAVRATPDSTSGELAALTGIERHEVSRRLSDLERAGSVSKGAARKCGEMGTRQTTWRTI